MQKLTDCGSCLGFLPPGATSCPNCGARRRTEILRYGTAAAVSLFSVLLMACYGQIEAPDCLDGPDNDGDGWPSSAQPKDGSGCNPTAKQDCNDHDPSIHPGADDPFGDGIDQNCDGHDGVECPSVDNDGDGYRVWTAAPDCWVPGADQDCDDNDPHVHPGAFDKPGDGIDQDCNGKDNVVCKSTDADHDGYRAYIETDGCTVPRGVEQDCDDTDPKIHPHGAPRFGNCGVP